MQPRTTVPGQVYALLAGLFAIALTPLLSSPVLPFIDFYNHIARYHVLAQVGRDPFLQQYYSAHWALVPNIGMDFIGSLLLRFIPAAIAPHVIAAIIMASQFLGVLYFHRQLTGRLSLLVALLLVPLLYSFILNWGFSNFLFGLGLVFGAAGWWLANRARGWRAAPVAAVFAVLIFLDHGFVFALYGLLLATLELGLAWQARDLRLTALVRRLAPVAVQAVVPVILFTSSKLAQSRDGVSNADQTISRLMSSGGLIQRLFDLMLYRIETIVRVAEGPSYPLDLLWSAGMVTLLGWLVARGRLRLSPVIWPALAAGVLLIVIVPPTMFGIGYVSDRLPLYTALLLVAALQPVAAGGRANRLAVGAVAALVAVRLVSIAASWQTYARQYDEFVAVTRALPRGALVNDLMVGGTLHVASLPRCSMWGPMLTAQFGMVTPLFADAAAQPLLQRGPLAEAVTALGRQTEIWKGFQPALYDGFLQRMQAAGKFDYVLVCNAEYLPRPLATVGRVVARTPHFELIRLR